MFFLFYNVSFLVYVYCVGKVNLPDKLEVLDQVVLPIVDLIDGLLQLYLLEIYMDKIPLSKTREKLLNNDISLL